VGQHERSLRILLKGERGVGSKEGKKVGEDIKKDDEGNRLTLLVPMRFHIPEGMYILRIIFLVTSNFNLLESPLRQDSVRSP